MESRAECYFLPSPESPKTHNIALKPSSSGSSERPPGINDYALDYPAVRTGPL